MESHKYIISGGGTGGHIFPALSIANEIRRRDPQAKFLFVGAKGRMEEEKVPAAGYEILTLPVKGLDRKRLHKNIPILYRLIKGLFTVRKVLKAFAPDIAIGVGGYASAPTLITANLLGVPTLVQEQNSYAGVTNKIVGRWAKKVCVAYKGMERFFPKENIILTGNPVRQDLFEVSKHAPEAYEYFGLRPDRKTVLVIGGSLGAKTINDSISAALGRLAQRKDIQVIWQTGKGYIGKAKAEVQALGDCDNIVVTDFVYKMDLAFSVADLVVSRAGAGSISEFCLLELPVILVPSPNVSEDHQTKNAMALVNEGAAIMVKDSDAREQLASLLLDVVDDDDRRTLLSRNISKLALKDSAKRIVDEIEYIIAQNKRK
ncbi:UDP-N-acetylglucosamine--N-acetylmuramyl-(pentapeptide) pyrophosphoryl-undecaprenol N-acetylglucosamine transferase [Porphyromonas cangingivalis]|uniref:UDP-N-acetylglucosamine--N-acetylmuramyl-(pentapeptide) pyrophosphoryl-undecaprenol N-acetylglucosamine transferase n=1 Tax=Porphyromonas cangingivalis TaxID=36874 RepID=A0A0A2EVF6_PORCN|nr:undecaprenyldiphospho-muramoylpentapeptide beta-N-acetylglucosaminyltransferase [Porphyromonas cangingivalis]KGN81692.1 UDP-diphospho-muramoylpentapeptide beta-N-acetylglucosaminyltransferase [Porphyromonas cangingivalis]SPY34480.1 UDP-N-acetylglucosamine--N-acetylmuramyl-(pentapeptide) pyrophosphoryl-undecaprenol N-acetylglucosamine transferase [Porphyromonas cangingivalis]